MRFSHPRIASLIGAMLFVVASAPAWAQEETPTAVGLLTPYLGVAVEPGDTTNFNIEVVAPPGEEVSLEVDEIPQGWTAEIRGGGFLVDRVLVDGDLRHNLRLEVTIPADAAEGSYALGLAATGINSSDRLDFDITVAEAVGGGVSLSAEFPFLQGPSDVTFTFTLELSNETAEEIQFGLQVEGPAGWQLAAWPSGQTRASTVTLGAGESQRITAEADPPDLTTAGAYLLTVAAAGGGEVAATDLGVEITGSYEMALVTQDERLNVDVEAGKSSELPLGIINLGTAALTDVTLSATPPRGWEVSFDAETIASIEPGGSAEVIATVTAADDAITGDYRITFRARVPETSDQIEIRATVKTSALWGLIGILVIVAALVALGMVFRRYGRR
jgi:uncharacterized membrane protein